MSRTAKAYIALVIVSGALLLLLAAGSWSSANPKQFVIYLGLAALASVLKVRIPGMESTMSPNLVFLLLGMVALPFSQVAVISLAAALVQSLWASAKRPRLVQVAFSAAALVISCSLAYKFAHLVLAENATGSRLVSVILAGTVYFPVNSIFVSMVVGLVEGQSLKQISGAVINGCSLTLRKEFCSLRWSPAPTLRLRCGKERWFSFPPWFWPFSISSTVQCVRQFR